MVRLNAAEYDTLCRVLGDTPETVIAVHLLQRGLCLAYAVGQTEPPTGWKPVGSMCRRLQARLTGRRYSPSTRKSPSAFVTS